MTSSPPVASPRPARRRRFIVAAALLPVVLLALLEIVLRLAGVARPPDAPAVRFMNPESRYVDWGDGPVRRDPVLFWRLRAGASNFGTNERIARSGYRTEFAVVKANGARRIACVGDSTAYGVGLTAEKAWPAVLGRTLGAKSEVLNLGVPGYTSWQMRRLVETELEPLAPDVVVVEAGAFNEWVPAVGASDRAQGKSPSWARLRIVEFIERARRPPPEELDIDTVRARVAHVETASYDGVRRVPPDEFEDDLRAIATWCTAHGARVVFLAHPLPAETVRRNPIAAEYAATIRRVAADLGAPLADGWEAFRASGETDAQLHIDFCHASDAGCALLAHTVETAIARLR